MKVRDYTRENRLRRERKQLRRRTEATTKRFKELLPGVIEYPMRQVLQ